MADLNLSASPSSGGKNPKASAPKGAASKETPKLRMSPAGDHSPVSRTAGAIIGVVSVVALRAITKEDMKLIPGGEKIAKLLHIR